MTSNQPIDATAPALRVRLIGKANGVGLSRDLDLLAGALRANGCEVSVRGCEKRDRKRRRSILVRLKARAHDLRRRLGMPPPAAFDVNVMLEHVWPQFLHEARLNVLVPNPEWFDRRDLAFLGCIQQVWAKTAHAAALFGARGSAVLRIGFDSEDRLDEHIGREPKFLHLAGRSPLKGTGRLRKLWLRHPEWPMLTIVQDDPAAGADDAAAPAREAANLTSLRGYLDDAALRILQNSHRWHLCTSEAEGWGHYIAEAMGVGAVTLTVDAPPMNELVTAGRGLLVAAHASDTHNLVRLSLFDEAALEAAVAQAIAMQDGPRAAMSTAARGWFLDNKRDFAAQIGRAVAQLPQ